MARIACLLLLCVAACGSTSRPFTDGGEPPEDGGVHDAAPDGPPADATPPPGEAREIISGGGRATSTTYTLEVEIGHPHSQAPSTSATYTIEGNTAIKP